MNVEYYLGVIVGAVSGLAFVAILVWIISKFGGKVSMFKSKRCQDYDERQILVRSKAFKYAFFTLIIYSLIVQLIDEISGIALFSSLGGSWIGRCLSIALFVVYCVWNDAYISMRDNKKGILMLFGAIAVLNIVISIIGVIHNDVEYIDKIQIIKDGVLTNQYVISFQSMNLVCGLLFMVICIAIVIKSFVEKKEEEE